MDRKQNHPEIVIIGAGVIGSSLAYHLAREGRGVLVIERASPATHPAASWASAGGVRRQGRHQAEAVLALQAIARWPSLEQELEADLHYHQGGNLLLAESDEEAEQLAAFVQKQQELGFGDVGLLNQREVLSLVPGLHQRVTAGSYSPADGQADPALTTRAFADAAQRHGAIFWNNTAVLSLVRKGDRIIGVCLPEGEIHAGQVVLAAGAWSDELAATIGIHLPIVTHALQMVRSTPASTGLLIPVLSAVNRALSLKQLPNGSFLIGGGWKGDPSPDRLSYTLRPKQIEGNWKTACELLPIVGKQRIEQAWCGLEAISVDEIPFLGAVPGLQSLFLALGFSGHGFALSPAVGHSLANLLAGRSAPELADLSPAQRIQYSWHP